MLYMLMGQKDVRIMMVHSIFLICGVILLSGGILQFSPYHLHILHKCSIAHMSYMFLGQKIMRISVVLSILYF